MSTIRVLLADDHPVLRSGIRSLLEREHDIEVIGEASDGVEALRLVDELSPDVLVLDVEMPKASGVEVARRLDSENKPVRVLALSSYDYEHYIFKMLERGIAGYLTKEELPEEIVGAVRGIANGEDGLVSRSVAAKMARRVRTGTRSAKGEHGLTERELEVLSLMAEWLSNAEISRELSLSQRTVDNYVSTIYSKIGVPRRPKAIAWAQEHGITRSRLKPMRADGNDT